MIYCDYGYPDGWMLRSGDKLLKRYSAFTSERLMSYVEKNAAHTIIYEDESDGRVWWWKNVYKNAEDKELTKKELKQFFFQKLSSEIVR
jgi:hypothetical protein